MRVLRESWYFCNGGGKSERMKAAIFYGKAPAMARINGGGTGFLIHRNLLLTTHANLPSVAAVEAAEIRLHNVRVSSARRSEGGEGFIEPATQRVIISSSTTKELFTKDGG